MNKPNILIIENSIAVTGALKSITVSAHNLKPYFNFLFIIPAKGEARPWIEQTGFNDIEEFDLREISKKIGSFISYLPYLLLNTCKIIRQVKKKNIDLIHVNDLYNIIPAVIRMVGIKVPYVCHVRFLPDRFPPAVFNFWLRLHIRYAEKIIVVSDFLKNKLPKHSKIIHIPDQLPFEEKYPALLRQNASGYFTFLYLSNYIRGKGHDYALKAFSAVHEELPGWKLRFVGGDMGMEKNRTYKAELMAKARSLNILQKIEWSGFTTDVEKEYKDADIVLNFSESESFSITCLEALYYGRPLIATDSGGPAEIIDHEKTGLIISNKNVNAMVEAMRKLAQNPDYRWQLGIHARESVAKKFGPERSSLLLKTIYNEALKST